MARKIEVEIIGDASSLEHAFGKARSSSEGLGHHMGTVLKVGAIAAGVGLTGAAFAAKRFFDEATGSQKVAAQTTAVLKSTGGAANVTAKQVDGLANSILNKTGIDDEATKSGENLLLTFTNIRNEAGKGNDIFNQTTKIMDDMSVSLGQSTTTSAIQLGKALNDPIKGISALQRVGVSFTESQKDQIKTLVESGHSMAAQKIILAELSKEFGGSAEAAGKTFSGQLEIAKQQLLNTGGAVIESMIPALTAILKGINLIIPPMANWIGQMADKLQPTLQRVADYVVQSWPGIQHVFEAIWRFVDANLVPIIVTLNKIWINAVINIAEVLKSHWPEIRQIFESLGEVLKVVWTILDKTLIPILRIAFQDVLPVVLGIAITALSKILDPIGTVTDAFRTVGRTAKNIFDDIVDYISGFPKRVEKPVAHFLDSLGPITEGFHTIHGAVNSVIDAIKWVIDHLPDLGKAWDKVKSLGSKLNPFGDGVASIVNGSVILPPGMTGTGPTSISSGLWDDIALGTQLGLTITSGYRPGSITSTGNNSLHGVFPSKAVDLGGSEGAMEAFFRQEIGRPGIAELIHSPYWWHPGAGVTRIPASAGTVLADHYNHVHVGIFDQGGWLQPGLTLALNATGKPERIVAPNGAGGGDFHIHFDGPVYGDDRGIQELTAKVRRELLRTQTRNGSLGFN